MHLSLKRFLIWLRDFLANLIRSVSVYGPGIISVLISYFLLINIPQGQDVVIQVGEYAGPFFWTLGCVLIWTYFSWYSSRMVGYQKKDKTSGIPEAFHRHIPRLIAFNGFLSVQIAILALPTMLDLSQTLIWVFVALHNVLYILLTNIFTKEDSPKWVFLAAIIIIGGYFIMLLQLSIGKFDVPESDHHSLTLPLVAIALFIMQCVSLKLFIRRREQIPPANVGPAKTFLKFFGMEIVPVPESLHRREQVYFTVFNIFAMAAAVLYVAAIVSIPFADVMGPLAFILLAFGMLVGAANVLTLISVKTNVNLFIAFLLLAIFSTSDPFQVRVVEGPEENYYSSRPTLEAYFERWVLNREESIENSSEFPVYLILADGGASRSGYWVAAVLSAWQDESRRYDSSGIFSNHLLSLSGASGGSVGNATFYALLKQNYQDAELLYSPHATGFLRTDFLTYSIGHYFGPDIVQHIVPLPVTDRAGALEDALAYASKEKLFGWFDKPFSEVMDTTGKLPILFMNTTEVQTGTPGVVSSIKISDFSKDRIDVLSEVDHTWNEGNGGDLKLSTAAILSARFPYISPAGGLNNKYYVDGGYFDNSGAGITHEMMQHLKTITNESKDTRLKKLYDKLSFHLVHISNTPVNTEPPGPIHPFANELAAPILTVLNTYNSQTKVNDQRLVDFISSFPRGITEPDINLYTRQDTVGYPMNWVISDYNLNKMNQRLEDVKKNLKKRYPEKDTGVSVVQK